MWVSTALRRAHHTDMVKARAHTYTSVLVIRLIVTLQRASVYKDYHYMCPYEVTSECWDTSSLKSTLMGVQIGRIAIWHLNTCRYLLRAFYCWFLIVVCRNSDLERHRSIYAQDVVSGCTNIASRRHTEPEAKRAYRLLTLPARESQFESFLEGKMAYNWGNERALASAAFQE